MSIERIPKPKDAPPPPLLPISSEPLLKCIDGLSKSELWAKRCNKCELNFFPPVSHCKKCLNSELEWVKISGEAQLVTYSICNIVPVQDPFGEFPGFVPDGMDERTPYVIAIAKLAQAGQVTSWLRIDDPAKIRIGMKLRLEPVQYQDGRVSYQLVPAEEK